MTRTTSPRRMPTPAPPLLAMALAALLAACGAAAPADAPVVRDSAGTTIVENAPGADARVARWTVGPEPALRIGVVDGEPAYQFHRLWAGARLSDGRIVVADGGSGEIRMFGRDGRLVARQGRPGDGPGEYRSPQALWVLPGDTVAVFDPRLSRVTLLEGDGLALARVATSRHGLANPTFAGTLEGGRAIVVMDRQYDISGPIQPQYADIWTVSLDGEAPPDSVLRVVHGHHGRVPGGEAMGRLVGSPIFGAMGMVAARGGQIVYGPGNDYTLHVHGPDGARTRIVRWHGPDRTIEPRDVSLWIDSVVALAPPERRADERRWWELQPIADGTPAHHRILHDTAGRIWVARWSPWRDELSTDWWIFDPEGRLTATASMPRGLWVLEIGEDEVLATATDDMDVEYLVALPIARSDR